MILSEITNLKTYFSIKPDGIPAAVEHLREGLGDCAEQVRQTEIHISAIEDTVPP